MKFKKAALTLSRIGKLRGFRPGFPVFRPGGTVLFLCNVYKCRGGGPGGAYGTIRNCCSVTRGWQISAAPSRFASSIGTAVIWLLS